MTIYSCTRRFNSDIRTLTCCSTCSFYQEITENSVFGFLFQEAVKLSRHCFISATPPCEIPDTWKTPDVDPMLLWCWASVADGGPTLQQHWVSVLCLLGARCTFVAINLSLLRDLGAESNAAQPWNTFLFILHLYNLTFLSPAHEVGAGDIVITMSGRAAVRPCFVSGRYLWNR